MKNIFSEELEQKLAESGLIAVVEVQDSQKIVPLAKTLLDEGVSVMELTLRTEGALDALELLTREVPEMTAGVGTVLQPKQIDEIISRRAQFGVAPGLNTDVLERAIDRKFPFAPGITTASDIESAISRGCRVLKFFPAEAIGGVDYLKSMNGPYSFLNLKYIPLGGLNSGNMATYLERPEILAIGGSWIAHRDLIKNEDWKTIAANAREGVRIFKEIRG